MKKLSGYTQAALKPYNHQLVMYFALLLGLLAYISPSLADVDLEVRGSPTYVEVVYHWSDNGTTESIMALNEKGELIGSAKGGTLNAGNFVDTPITISFTDPLDSAGTIVVGGTTFPLQSNEEDTTSPDCGRISGGGIVEALCTLSISSNTYNPQPVSRDEIYMDLSHSMIVEQLNAQISNGTDATEGSNATTSHDLVERQGCFSSGRTERWKKPHPRQWHLASQRSENQKCQQRGCSVSVTDAEGWTFGAMIGLTFGWITGGFSVAKTSTVAEAHTCNGDAHDTVCVWYSAGYTSYTVKNVLINCCNGDCLASFKGLTEIRSPNKHDKHSYFYCVYGEKYCRNKGAHYWNKGHKGGP